jgi:hypothetical protein
MPEEDKEKLNNIEKLKGKLFSKSYSTKIQYHEGFSAQKKGEVASSWEGEKNARKELGFFAKTSVFKKFFFASIIFFMLSLGYVSYMFFFGGNTVSNDNINISVFGNNFTDGGEALPLQIEIVNKNTTPLELVDLVVEYPKGSTGDLSQETERVRESLGTIPSGGVKNENINVILFGEQGSVRPVKIILEYRVEGSNAIFVKEKYYEVSINSTPINLLVNAPGDVSPNQDITLNITTSLNTSRQLPNTLIKLDYPLGFQFASAEPAPILSNNVWNMGDLLPGEEFKITVTGKMVDVYDGEEKTFHVLTGSQSRTDKSLIDVVFNSLAHTVLIQKPFVDARLFINNVYDRAYASNSTSVIHGEIRWANNLDTKINDLSIRAKLSGNALNRKSIESSTGFYNSSLDTIIWDKNSYKEFAEVEAGSSGSVLFSFSPVPVYSPGGILPDPTIKIEVSVSGKQALQGNQLKELHNSESKIIRIISDVGFTSKVLYHTGAFANKGPMPPKVEEETTYTVVWTITNLANNISRAEVRSSLPQWVNYVGKVSPEDSDISYNPVTKQIIWKAGNIPKGAGIIGDAKEISFQISFVPSLSQIGTLPLLLNESVLTVHDDFANVDITAKKSFHSTSLPNDPQFKDVEGRVVE